MSNFYIHVSGRAITHARIHVPQVGAWWADLEFADEAELSSGTLSIGSVDLVGTVVAARSGTHALQRKCRIVAGKNGWASSLPRHAYHNDAGIKASQVISDAATEAGETVGTAPTNLLPGVDYIREAGTASKTIEDCSRGVPWFVDYAGITHVKERTGSADPALYQVLHFDPKYQEIEIVTDQIDSILPGMTVDAGLDAPLKISSLDIDISPEEIRIRAWCGGDERSQLSDALRSIVKGIISSKLFGKYRYRVVSMAGDRVNIQSVRASDGLPDALSISMNSAAGIHAILSLGAHVFVEFEAGDRSLPMITSFAGKDGIGHVPQQIELGGADTSVARAGDLTQAGGPGLIVTLVPVLPAVPAPPNAAVVAGVPHFISFSPIPIVDATAGSDCQPLYGAILNGSLLVKTKAGA